MLKCIAFFLYITLTIIVVNIEANSLALSSNYENYYEEIVPAELRMATNCTKQGYRCKSCTQVSYCVYISGNSWLEYEVNECKDGQTCLSSTGSCSSAQNPSCSNEDPDNKFICRQPGIFPDLYNCRRYHICSPKQSLGSEIDPDSKEMECDADYAFDPLTTQCKTKLTNGTCSGNIPSCKQIGQSVALKGNPNLYYICLPTSSGGELVPNLYRCPNNQIYDDVVENTCVDPVPSNGLDDSGKCKQLGNYYDPSSCFTFNYCSSTGAIPSKRSCSTKMYFDPKTKLCTDFKCSDLK